MQPGFSMPYGFSVGSIRAHAPAMSGVYGISNGCEWIYIGEADNIQQRLLEHLAEDGTQLKARVPTGFSYEVCNQSIRVERQDRLILQYEPVCNRRPVRGWRNRG
jgi:hypothetical protein